MTNHPCDKPPNPILPLLLHLPQRMKRQHCNHRYHHIVSWHFDVWPQVFSFSSPRRWWRWTFCDQQEYQQLLCDKGNYIIESRKRLDGIYGKDSLDDDWMTMGGKTCRVDRRTTGSCGYMLTHRDGTTPT